VVKSIGKFEHASLQINFGTIDVGEAQKSMRLFATRLALTTEIFCEKIIAQIHNVESVASQARKECIRRRRIPLD
jgi:hypothetical protein